MNKLIRFIRDPLFIGVVIAGLFITVVKITKPSLGVHTKRGELLEVLNEINEIHRRSLDIIRNEP